MSLEQSVPSIFLTLSRFVDGKIRMSKNVLFGNIESYDPATRKAQVVIGVKERIWGKQVVDFPKVTNVPVVFPSSKKLNLSWKLEKGDPVIILFADRSMSEWLSTGIPLRPEDPRSNDITDAIAIPGLFPFTEVEAGEESDFALVYEGTTIRVDENGKFLIDSSDEIELKASSSIRVEAQADLEVVSVTGKFKVSVPTGTGKISMGNGVAEVLKVISDTLAQLAVTTVPTALGPQPLLTAAQFVTLKATIDQLLET